MVALLELGGLRQNGFQNDSLANYCSCLETLNHHPKGVRSCWSGHSSACYHRSPNMVRRSVAGQQQISSRTEIPSSMEDYRSDVFRTARIKQELKSKCATDTKHWAYTANPEHLGEYGVVDSRALIPKPSALNHTLRCCWEYS